MSTGREAEEQLELAFAAELAAWHAGRRPRGGEIRRIAEAAIVQGGQHELVGAALQVLMSLAALSADQEAVPPAAGEPGEGALGSALALLRATWGNFNLLFNTLSQLRPFVYTGTNEFEVLSADPELSYWTLEIAGYLLAQAIHDSPEREAGACRRAAEELAWIAVGLGMILRDRDRSPTEAFRGGDADLATLARYCARIAALPEEWREHAVANMTYRLDIDLRFEPKKARRSIDRPMVDHYLRLWSFLPHHGQTLMTLSDPETDRWARQRLAELRGNGAQVAEILRERVRAEQHRLAGAWPEINGN